MVDQFAGAPSASETVGLESRLVGVTLFVVVVNTSAKVS